jgi:putative Holliday junction resolvase
MRLLALDVGDRRIGIALSDESATLASGLPTYERVGPRKDVRAIAELVRQNDVGEVVIGQPRRLDGTLGPQAEKVQAFVDSLRPVLRVPLVNWDERFTTTIAEQTLIEAHVRRDKRKQVVDQVAAVLILQSYLDYRKQAGIAEPGPA